jgi:gamma-glutamyltranspeptidase/glutathione hydrolase
MRALIVAIAMAVGLPAVAQECKAPACAAVRGARTVGWPAQTRAEVMARNGMVTSSHPLATQAGLAILRGGGNAIDAAIATAAVMGVTEPQSTGIGGDMFLLYWHAKERKLYALNAAGRAPTGATADHYQSLGYTADPANWGIGSGLPPAGILTVTVPGAVWGWEQALKRFGTRDFRTVLADARRIAEQGYPVTERVAGEWLIPPALPLKGCCTAPDPETQRVFLPGGRAPRPGDIFRNPDLARAFAAIQAKGAAAFYTGTIAQAIVRRSSELGGTMTLSDLAGYRGAWVEPVTVRHAGYDIHELPPPSQDWGALVMLNVLEACMPKWAPGETLASLGPANPRYWHFLIEAKKRAYADLLAFNADPVAAKVPIERLLSRAHAEAQCAKVDPARASPTAPMPLKEREGDTVVLSTADAAGNMVAMVQSVASEWGSGITVPGWGILLHNRGIQFTLDRRSPNLIAPGKQPYHTLAAGFVTREGKPVMSLLLMGGDMQAQGHAQVLVNMLHLGANQQMASDMARFRHSQVTNELILEAPLHERIGPALAAMGHKLAAPGSGPVGGYQSIRVEETPAGRVYRAGSDHRKDGQAAGW